MCDIFRTIEGRALDACRKRQRGSAKGEMNDAKIDVRLEANRKERMVHARVSADEYATIERVAKAADMTVSGFFRSLILEGAGVRPILTDEDRAIMALLLEDMRAIGVNLNQVARSINSGKSVHPSEIDINLGNVQRIQAAVMTELRTLAKRAGHRRRGET